MRGLFLILPLLLAPVPAKAAFQIECDLKGKHGSKDIDRLDPSWEIELLQKGLEETRGEFLKIERALQSSKDPEIRKYAGIFSEIVDVMPKVRYVIHHKLEYDSDHYFGWSAEDDPEYLYPGTSLEGAGGIKVNITEMGMRMLELSHRMRGGPFSGGDYSEDTRLAAAMINYFAVFIAHELLHVRQYQTQPATSYYNYWHLRCGQEDVDCKDPQARRGLVEEMLQDTVVQGGLKTDLEASTKLKIGYEKDAYRLEHAISDGPGWQYIGQVLNKLAKGNAAFGKQGEFRTQAAKKGGTYFNEYAKGDFKDNWDPAKPLSEENDIYYNGQLFPMEAIRNLRELEIEIRSGERSRKNRRIWKKRAKKLRSLWRRYVERKDAKENPESWIYLKDARPIYKDALKRVKNALKGRK